MVDVAHWNIDSSSVAWIHGTVSFGSMYAQISIKAATKLTNSTPPLPFLLQHQCSFACVLNNKTTSYKSCSSCSEEKSPLVTVSLTPNNTLNTKTIGGMTCLCFLGPIKRDLTLQAASTLLSYRGYSREVCKTRRVSIPSWILCAKN